MTNFDRQSLHQFLTRRYDLEGLKTLCLYLEVDYDNLDGRTKDSLARELIRYMERVERMGELVAMQAQAEAAQARRNVPPERLYPLNHDPRRVFISHAHQDAAFAHQLAADLERAGIPVWIAPESIRPGEQWLPAIARGLQESGVCAVVLTPDGVASAWVEYETNLAIGRERKKQMRLLLLDVVECDVPFGWTGYQFLPFRGDYAAGLAALRARLSGMTVETFRGNVLDATGEKTAHRPVSTPPDRRIHEKTGIELIRIPGGSFLYGGGKRQIDLPEYWIGRYPVTNAQYKRFLDANPQQRIPYWDTDWARPYNWDEKRRSYPADKTDHPVVLVSWHDAKAFCEWAGLLLPTEEQWEKAARGTGGREWPWGNEWVEHRANTSEAGIKDTTPVGKYSPQGDSPSGCADMAGNVWEWTDSWYDETQRGRVLRGGSWLSNQWFARVSVRRYGTPGLAYYNYGFRVAAPVGSGF